MLLRGLGLLGLIVSVLLDQLLDKSDILGLGVLRGDTLVDVLLPLVALGFALKGEAEVISWIHARVIR